MTTEWHDGTNMIEEELRARLVEKSDEIVTLRRKLRIALEALHEDSRHGIRADTMPTIGGVLGDGHDIMRWYEYLKRADDNVKNAARAALKEIEEG